MKTEQLAALISLLHVPLVGAYKARNLVTIFHEIKDIFTLSKTDLCRVDGIDVETSEQIRNNYDLDLGQKELEKAAKSGVTILSLGQGISIPVEKDIRPASSTLLPRSVHSN